MLDIIFIFIVVFFSALLMEKVFAPELTLLGAAISLQNHLKAGFKYGLELRKKQQLAARTRIIFHDFEWHFSEKLNQYIKHGSYLECGAGFSKEVPTIFLKFLPAKNFSKEELEDIATEIFLKFGKYLTFRYQAFGDVILYHFVTFSKIKGEVYFSIHYVEFEDDLPPFEKLYTAWSSQDSTTAGLLKDEKLEEELKKIK